MPNFSEFTAHIKLIEALETRAKPIYCAEDYILFSQGEPPRGIFIIRRGEVSLTMNAMTGEQLLSLDAGAGSLLGLPGVVANEPYSLTATAQQGSEISFVANADFEEIIRTDPFISLGVCQVLAAEVRTARRALAGL